MFDYTIKDSGGDTYEGHIGAALDGNNVLLGVSNKRKKMITKW